MDPDYGCCLVLVNGKLLVNIGELLAIWCFVVREK